MKRFICFLILIITLIILYARYIEPNHFNIKENTISSNLFSESFDGFKIVQFSDLLLGSTTDLNYLNNVVNKINELNPDIVIYTGDLALSSYEINEDELITSLKKIDPKMTKYAILGDNDLNRKDLIMNILEKSDFIILDNKTSLLFYKDSFPISITGFTDFEKIEDTVKTDDLVINYKIALIHKPDDYANISDLNYNLVLAGHSLGGLINIPFYGSLIKKDGSNIYVNNSYEINNTLLYVSNGLGCEKYNLRLLNKPSISLYRLEFIK